MNEPNATAEVTWPFSGDTEEVSVTRQQLAFLNDVLTDIWYGLPDIWGVPVTEEPF